MRWKSNGTDLLTAMALGAVGVVVLAFLLRAPEQSDPTANVADAREAVDAPGATATPTAPRPGDGSRTVDGVVLPDPEAVAKLTMPAHPLLSGAPEQIEFVVSSFNVLGSSHTTGSKGRKGRMASGPSRAGLAGQLLTAHDVDVVGLQELQANQVRPLLGATGNAFSIYPGLNGGLPRDSENSIAWRTSEWDLVTASTVSIPYFHGRSRNMPVVRLKHRASGREMYFMNFHNPATTPRWGDNSAWRAKATQIEADLVNRTVAKAHVPVFVTGDMNDRDRYFCAITAWTPLHASNGGKNADGTCAPPEPSHVDWILGTPEAEFIQHIADRGTWVRRATDHPMIVSRVRIQNLSGAPGAASP